MKKWIYLLPFLLLSCDGASQDKEEKGDKFAIAQLEEGVQCDKIEGRQLGPEEEFPEDYTGIIKQCYANGMLHRIGYFEHSKQEGVARSFYMTGVLKVDALWKNGELNGKTTAYYANGEIQSTLSYKDNKKHGLQTMYSPNGQIQSKANFNMGEFEGEYITYYENGNMRMKTIMVNGKPDPDQTEQWDENGEKIEE